MSEKTKHVADAAVRTSAAIIDIVDGANSVVKFVSAGQAFRHYKWLQAASELNKSRNLRGMVLDRQWRTLYRVTDDGIGKRLEKAEGLRNAMLLAVLALNVCKRWPDIEAVWKSEEALSTKCSKLASITSALLIKTAVADTAVFGLHAVLKAAREGLFVEKLLTGSDLSHPTKAQWYLDFIDRRLDGLVDSAVDTLTTGGEQYAFVRLHVRG